MKKAILILILILLVGCNVYEQQLDVPVEQTDEITGHVTQKYIKQLDLGDIETSIFKQVNQIRKDNDVRALSLDGEMIEIARSHSIDMAENDYFYYLNAEGQDATARAIELGFDRKKWDGEWQDSVLLENIGKVYGESFKEPEEVARAVVDEWLTNQDATSTMLTEGLTHTGVGVAFDGENYLITQNFW